jgi:hypothetical protein
MDNEQVIVKYSIINALNKITTQVGMTTLSGLKTLKAS